MLCVSGFSVWKIAYLINFLYANFKGDDCNILPKQFHLVLSILYIEFFPYTIKYIEITYFPKNYIFLSSKVLHLLLRIINLSDNLPQNEWCQIKCNNDEALSKSSLWQFIKVKKKKKINKLCSGTHHFKNLSLRGVSSNFIEISQNIHTRPLPSEHYT